MPEGHNHASVLNSVDRPLTSTTIRQGSEKSLILPIGERSPKMVVPSVGNNRATSRHESQKKEAARKHDSSPGRGTKVSRARPPYPTSKS